MRGKLSAGRVALALAWLVWLGPTLAAGPAWQPAEPSYSFRSWGREDGLPEDSATAVVQTRDGYLWLGTWNGLVRFNGERFTVFDPRNTPSLPSDGILNLHVDRHDRLWVSTVGGPKLRTCFHGRPIHDYDDTRFDSSCGLTPDFMFLAFPERPASPDIGLMWFRPALTCFTGGTQRW